MKSFQLQSQGIWIHSFEVKTHLGNSTIEAKKIDDSTVVFLLPCLGRFRPFPLECVVFYNHEMVIRKKKISPVITTSIKKVLTAEIEGMLSFTKQILPIPPRATESLFVNEYQMIPFKDERSK